MRVVVSGGGTAGHINPALALADLLKEQGVEVYYAGTPNGVESRLVPEAGFSFVPFEASGFNRSHPSTLFKGINLIEKSTKKAKAWFRQIQPDAVVVFGGYVCIPVGRAAASMSIPLIVHEQNSVMGMANKYLAKKADEVCLTYAEAGESISDKSKITVTGNPVRKSIFDATKEEGRKLLGVPDDALMLLIFGGSLGARHINTAVVDLKEKLLHHDNLYIVHVTGPKELETVTKRLNLTEEEAARWLLFGYQNQMGACMAAADIIISRAGATSLAEISALAKPALLVPFPYATNNHQATNARSYVEAGCAYMIPDDEIESERFEQLLNSLIVDESVRENMHKAAKEQNTRDASKLLAEKVFAHVDK